MEDTQDIFAQPEKPKGPKHFKTPPEEPAVNAAASAAPQEPRAAAPEPDFSGLDIVVEEGGQAADGLATDALERFTFDADLMDSSPAAGFAPEPRSQDRTQAFTPSNTTPVYPSGAIRGQGDAAAAPVDRTQRRPFAQARPYDTAPNRPVAAAPRREDTQRVQSAIPAYAPEAAVQGGSAVNRGNDAPKRHRRSRHPILSGFLWMGIFFAAAMCALRMLPVDRSSGRIIPEIVAFMPWLIVPVAVIFVLALLWRRLLLIPVSGICLALLLWWHGGYFVPANRISDEARTTGQTQVSTEDRVVRVMTLNTLNGHANAAQVVQAVRDNNVEVLALQEVTRSFLDELSAAGIYDVLPYYVFGEASQWDNGGINVLYSMAPMSNQNSNLLPMELSSMPAGSIDCAGTTLRFVSIHPGSPHLGGHNLWNTGLSTIGSLSEYDHRYVIMGDFNSTWDHARFRELLGTTFVDASQQAGEGFHMSYPANILVPLIEIDHIVYTKDVGVRAGDLKCVRIDGTDHFALVATLEVNG